tara:strand:- start:207996 stop:209708 length:1713 start_codon:yes stop_codon:yes gene_type:complete
MKKPALIVSAIVLLIVVGAVAWAYFAFVYAKPLTQAELKELTPDWSLATNNNWSPWYTDPNAGPDAEPVWNPSASYNTWVESMPEADKAWPEMARLEAQFSQHPGDILLSRYLGLLPTETVRWPALAPLLASPQSDELHARLMVELAKPHLGGFLTAMDDPHANAANIEFTPSVGHVQAPFKFDPLSNDRLRAPNRRWLSAHRTFTEFLVSKAAYKLEAGDPDEFVRTIAITYRSATLGTEYPSTLSQMVQSAIQGLCMETISWAIEHHRDQLTEEHLRIFETLLADPAHHQRTWQGESLKFHDSMRRACTHRGGFIKPLGGLSETLYIEPVYPVALPDDQLLPGVQQTLLANNQILIATYNASRIPWNAEPIDRDKMLAQRDPVLPPQGMEYLEFFTLSLQRVSNLFRSTTQQNIALRVGIAAHRHHLRHGAFPESINAIDTDLLTLDPIGPIDAFTNEPLLYTLTASGPVVYSVGEDHQDNGGTQAWSIGEREQFISKSELGTITHRSVKYTQWLTKDQALTKYPPRSNTSWGDWVLFPIPTDDPDPLSFDYNDLTDEYFIDEQEEYD